VTIRERLGKLIENGAAIQLLFEDAPMKTLLLAGALWRQNPTCLRWCAVFPEHQGHVHETSYSEVRLENDGRDIAFFEDGRMVAYVVPYEESGHEVDAMRENLGEWQYLVSRYKNAVLFAEFLETA